MEICLLRGSSTKDWEKVVRRELKKEVAEIDRDSLLKDAKKEKVNNLKKKMYHLF